MTDKLKLFKVRLASGAERFVVGPTGADVWGLKFSTAQKPEDPGQNDEIVSVESIVPVDFVLLREPVAKPEARRTLEACPACLGNSDKHDCRPEVLSVGMPCPQCGGVLRSTLGQLTCNLGHQLGDAPRDIAGDANRRLSAVPDSWAHPGEADFDPEQAR